MGPTLQAGNQMNIGKAAEAAFLDVTIIGAGLAGACAANVLARAGYRVAVVDTQAAHPTEFRAEKLGALHMSLFERLGLEAIARSAVTPMDDIRVYRFGKLISQENRREYGFAYASLVNAIRRAMPASVAQYICRVESLETGAEQQVVRLNDGRVLKSRLLVISTGLGDAVKRKAGFGRTGVKKAHSLSLAFSFANPASSFPFQSLNYFGHRRRDKIGYLTLFPIDNVMRANFFIYHEAKDEWTRQFRAAPQQKMQEMMPEIAAICDDFRLDGHVEVRQIDLTTTQNASRDGVVLLGDAFCSTCPAPGVGIQRVLTDVAQLCTVHLPQWLKTPGMDARKIAQFYSDPAKLATDARAMRLSVYSRAMVVEEGALWTACRLRNDTVRRAWLWQAQAVRWFGRITGNTARKTGQQPTREIMKA